MKLIEGITGEKAIYRRRGEKDPEESHSSKLLSLPPLLSCSLPTFVHVLAQMGSPQQKPKLLRLLCDVSGSMYRFNGHDARMDRQLEAMLMVMEAFDNFEHKIKVSA